MRNATVTICHSKTENLKSIIQDSNIVVAAIGKPDLIDKLIGDPKQKVKALW